MFCPRSFAVVALFRPIPYDMIRSWPTTFSLSSLTNEREIQTLVFDLGGRSITVIVIITITITISIIIIISSSSSFAFIRLRSPSSSALRIHQRNIAQLVPITTILTTMRQRCGEKKGDDLRIGHRLGILWYSWTILDPVFRLSGFSPAHNVV